MYEKCVDIWTLKLSFSKRLEELPNHQIEYIITPVPHYKTLGLFRNSIFRKIHNKLQLLFTSEDEN